MEGLQPPPKRQKQAEDKESHSEKNALGAEQKAKKETVNGMTELTASPGPAPQSGTRQRANEQAALPAEAQSQEEGKKAASKPDGMGASDKENSNDLRQAAQPLSRRMKQRQIHKDSALPNGLSLPDKSHSMESGGHAQAHPSL